MRMQYRVAWVMLLIVSGVSVFPLSGAALMIQLSLEELTARADTIVVGTVTSQESAWNAQHTAIYTDVIVAVEDAVKGTPPAEVTLRIAGGTVGQTGMRLSNAPVFRDGERVIVFLDTTEMPASVVGLHQGKYTVRDGTVTMAGQTLAADDFLTAIRAASR